ncbi:hypothetical protein [Cupriavidus oxalaticus]|uniref:hypothetical protein n=1 Tax=Cupriavidus oxalaticus TaxID=96344 RepID=UPI003D17E1C1
MSHRCRVVFVRSGLLVELARFRRAHGLAPTPQPGETRLLLLPVIGREGREHRDNGLSRGTLQLILKEVFGLAASRLRARAREQARAVAVSVVPGIAARA